MSARAAPAPLCEAAGRDDEVGVLVAAWLAEKAGAPGRAESAWSRPFGELGLRARDVLELLVRLEDHLEVVFENHELGPETLGSAAALSGLARSKRAARSAPRRRRLAHVTSEFLPHLSGTQRLISDLHAQLREWLDFEVYSFDLARGLAPQETLEGLPVRRFDMPRATDLLRLRRRYQAVAEHPGLNPEEVCNYDLRSSRVFSALQRERPDALVSYFYSGILAQDLVDFFPSLEWLLVPSFFQAPARRDPNPAWWDMRRVARLLLFQPQDYRAAREAGVPAEKLTLLPFPVDTDQFRATGALREADTLLYVGRLTANKGLRAFLETFRWMRSRRPSLRLRLVGDLDSLAPVEQQELPRLRAAIERLGLRDYVELAGRREGQALVDEYSRCRVHILPSIADCYSLATLEALSCGLTCVNLDNPRYEWQRARDGDGPLVHLCGTLPDMGRAVLDLVAARELPDHREYVVQHLSWSAHRDAYREFFLR